MNTFGIIAEGTTEAGWDILVVKRVVHGRESYQLVMRDGDNVTLLKTVAKYSSAMDQAQQILQSN